MNIDFNKNNDGLVPAIIQDATTKNVLMLGYMNEEAFAKTQETKLVTFYSRTKNRLWTKGEESGNVLHLVDMKLDCDNDTLLIKASPLGPTCHLENYSCFKKESKNIFSIISELENTIDKRKSADVNNSYVASLLKKGVKEIAKKITEEAGETSIAAVTDDGRIIDESADLVFHLLVLLKSQNYSLNDVLKELKNRRFNQ